MKAEVEGIVRKNKAAVELDAIAADVAKALREGASVATVAEKNKLQWQEKLAAKRGEGGVPFQLLQSAFAAPAPPQGQVTVEQTRLPNGDVLVFTVANVVDGKQDASEAMQNQMMRTFLARAQGMSTFEAYNNYLKSQADIEVR